MGQSLRFAKTTMKDCPMTAITPEQLAFVNARPALAGALSALIDELTHVDTASLSPESFARVESELGDRVQTLGSQVIGEVLRDAAATTPVVEYGDCFWEALAPSALHATTRFGPVTVMRSLYRRIGRGTRPTIDPVTLRCGLFESMTPACSALVGAMVAITTSREAARLLRYVGLRGCSRSTIERHGQALGAALESQREALEDALIVEYELPPGAVALSVSVDRITLPMREPKPRPVGRPRKGAPKHPIDVKFRMAYVGCWTLHDAEGNALYTCRYGRMPGEGGQHCVEEQLRFDVEALVEAHPHLKVATLADGAPEMLQMLERITANVAVTARLVDFWHASEYLGAALTTLPVDTKCELRRLKESLLNSHRGVQKVLLKLRTWEAECSGIPPEALQDAIRYFENKKSQMGYAAARATKLPVGSGHVEATAKTLVTMRMKRSGCRWNRVSGQHVLTLRSLWCSSRWEVATEWLVSSRDADGQPIREIA